MLEVLRTDRTRLKLTLVDYTDEANAKGNVLTSRRRTTARPNQFVYLRMTLLNQSRELFVLIHRLFLTLVISEIFDSDDELELEPK